MAPKTVQVDDLTCLVDVARRLGVTRQAASVWQYRHADFPKPIVVLANGPIFSRRAIDRWLRKTGRA